MILGVGLGDIKTSIKSAAPSLIFTILASIKPAQSIITTFATILYQPVVVQSVIVIQSLSFIVTLAISTNKEFSHLPIFSVTISTMVLMRAYIQNRSHKNGCLLLTQQKSLAILATACNALSSFMTCQSFPMEGLSFLSGALFTILMTIGFASTADVWYTVGSGQFQMCSLDTAGMMIYFILPAVVLYLRFLNQYGEWIGGGINAFVYHIGLEDWGIPVIGIGKFDNLLLILSVITAAGVPLLNAFCPMGGFLFSRAYTHGQPNTKKVAVCVNLSELGADTSTLLRSLDQSKSVLNIFVTSEDIQSHLNELNKLAKKGHYLALAPSENGSFTGPSLFGAGRASRNIKSTFEEYNDLFGEQPNWALSGSSVSLSRHPIYLRKAHNLGMKVTCWSTLVEVKGAKLSREQESFVVSDVIDKNGGSIIYITSYERDRKESLSTAVLSVVDALSDFIVAPLSQVVKDDATMAL